MEFGVGEEEEEGLPKEKEEEELPAVVIMGGLRQNAKKYCFISYNKFAVHYLLKQWTIIYSNHPSPSFSTSKILVLISGRLHS